MSTTTQERITTVRNTPTRNTTAREQELAPVTGILDRQDEHGFLRADGYLPGPGDVYVPAAVIRRYSLRAGDLIDGAAEPRPAEDRRPSSQGKTPNKAQNKAQSKARPLIRVDMVNGAPADQSAGRAHFAAMTPLYPQDRLRLETGPDRPDTRIMDLITPIGKGQRGLIVAQPKTGKTMLLQSIAASISRNHPESHLMVVLLDERPEEVTDMRRSVVGEVIAATFDRPAHEHIALAELAVERAKRLAELGQDVVILLDSITRLCRAHNTNARSGGRTLSGGVDAASVTAPKQLFGTARNLQDGGSVTILATALVETGSRADDYYFEELKSTGNMELRLDRALADRRIFPAIDIAGSGTRRDDLLVTADELEAVRRLRRVLRSQSNQQAAELLVERTRHTASNAVLLQQVMQTTPAGA